VISATSLEALAQAWRDFEARLEPRWKPGGVTFHGDTTHLPWVAVVLSPETGNSGPEGWGRDPFQAINELYVAIETGKTQLHIDRPVTDSSADFDELANRWRIFGSRLPDRWALGGITFRGHDGPRRWAAFLVRADNWQAGPTAEGADPFEAMHNLQAILEESIDDAGAQK
jgi:hypothetical protein